ncbi:MAG: BamA/TamA family outer membrane protein [Bacteroidota bacterium]
MAFNKTGLLFLLAACTVSVHAQQKNFMLRSMDWGYRIVQGDSANPHKKYFFPIPMVAYKPETRWIIGLSTTSIFRVSHDSITRPSFVRVNISYSQERQFAIRPQLELFTRNNMWNIRANYTYTDFAEFFWGMGIQSQASDRALYSFRMHRANVKAAYLVKKHLYAGAQYVFEKMFQMDVSKAPLLKQSEIVGSNGYSASGAGFYLTYDSRDNIYFPYTGLLAEVSVASFNPALGSTHRFTNVIADVRWYKQLWNENILDIQIYSQHNAGNIPFRMAATLGNEMFMRGYYTGRFRDDHALAIQAELRKHIWGPAGAVFFAGTGTASPGFNQLLKMHKPHIGAGLRIKAIPRERINMRFDYAIGVDGNSAAYISLNEAF